MSDLASVVRRSDFPTPALHRPISPLRVRIATETDETASAPGLRTERIRLGAEEFRGARASSRRSSTTGGVGGECHSCPVRSSIAAPYRRGVAAADTPPTTYEKTGSESCAAKRSLGSAAGCDKFGGPLRRKRDSHRLRTSQPASVVRARWPSPGVQQRAPGRRQRLFRSRRERSSRATGRRRRSRCPAGGGTQRGSGERSRIPGGVRDLRIKFCMFCERVTY